jgi:hypothetical protein
MKDSRAIEVIGKISIKPINIAIYIFLLPFIAVCPESAGVLPAGRRSLLRNGTTADATIWLRPMTASYINLDPELTIQSSFHDAPSCL